MLCHYFNKVWYRVTQGNVHKGSPVFSGLFGPPNHPLSYFVPFPCTYPKKDVPIWQKYPHPPSRMSMCISFFFSLPTGYGDNIFPFHLFCNKIWNCYTKSSLSISKPISMIHTKSFVPKNLSAGMFEKNIFPYYGLKDWTSFFWSTNQPALSHFVPFCLTNRPSQKSDVLYGRSLTI